jgi:hypothetical protein
LKELNVKIYETKSEDMDGNAHSKWTSSDGAAGKVRKAFKSARHKGVETLAHEIIPTRDGILAFLNERVGSTVEIEA